MSELSDTIKGCLQVKSGQVNIIDQNIACGTLTDRLIYNAVFHPDIQIKGTSRWLIKAIAQASQIFPASLNGVLDFSKQQGNMRLSIPVFQLPGFSYTMARAIFRAARENNARAFIFEMDSNQISHANQTLGEYSTIVAAAAVREGFKGPIFIQGNHILAHKRDFQQNPNQEKECLKKSINNAINCGFFNLWLDTFQVALPTQMGTKKNLNSIALLYAEITDSVRTLEPQGLDISLGCKLNPFQELCLEEQDIKEFMEYFQTTLQSLNPGAKGISKLGFSPESNSSTPKQINQPHELEYLDPNTLIRLSKYANEKYGLVTRLNLKPSDISQNTLKRFSGIGNAELKIQLEYQALIIDHHDFPSEFKGELNFNFPNRVEEEKIRSPISHKAFGIFKEKFWTLPEPLQQDISKELETTVSSLFKTLQIGNTQEWVFPLPSSPPVLLSLSKEMEICKKE